MTDFLAKCKGVAYSDMDSTTKGRWPWLDVVADYGAVGDGVTDDYTAFNNCLTDAVTLGKPVMVPAGSYALSTGLSVNSPITIWAPTGPYHTVLLGPTAGTILTLNGDADYSRIVGLHFQDLSSLGIGLHVYGPKYVDIGGCYFTGCGQGLRIETTGAYDCWYGSFHQCKFTSNAIAVKLDQGAGATYKPNRHHFIDCYFGSSTSHHVYLNSGDTIQFVKCNFAGAPTMLYVNDDNCSLIGCCLEGVHGGSNVYAEVTVNGYSFFVTDCSFSSGTWNIDTSISSHRLMRNANWKLQNRSIWLEDDGANVEVLYTGVLGEARERFSMDAKGAMQWGDGTSAPDTIIYRGSANCLTTDDTIKFKDYGSIASAETITLSAGNAFFINGTTDIKAITTSTDDNGRLVVLKFNGSLVVHDNEAVIGNLQLAGDFSATDGATLTLISFGINWWEISRSSN